VPDFPIPSAFIHTRLAYDDGEPPVFFGHYWLPADAKKEPVAPNLACLDYSVANGGSLTAYRWDGESKLKAEKFVAADRR
jgi:hypothetical protein